MGSIGSKSAVVSLLVVCLSILAACGGQGPSASTTATTSPHRQVPPPVTDAVAMRDSLLEIAMRSATTDSAEGFGIPSAWRAEYPGLEFADLTVPASPGTVSGNRAFPKIVDLAAGNYNVYILPFAVSDVNNNCAGGYISGYPGPTEYMPVEELSEGECSARSVAQFAAPIRPGSPT